MDDDTDQLAAFRLRSFSSGSGCSHPRGGYKGLDQVLAYLDNVFVFDAAPIQHATHPLTWSKRLCCNEAFVETEKREHESQTTASMDHPAHAPPPGAKRFRGFHFMPNGAMLWTLGMVA